MKRRCRRGGKGGFRDSPVRCSDAEPGRGECGREAPAAVCSTPTDSAAARARERPAGSGFHRACVEPDAVIRASEDGRDGPVEGRGMERMEVDQCAGAAGGAGGGALRRSNSAPMITSVRSVVLHLHHRIRLETLQC